MVRSRRQDVLYIGVGSHAVAIHAASGEELWRTRLKTASFVTALPGIAIQAVFIPLLVLALEKLKLVEPVVRKTKPAAPANKG